MSVTPLRGEVASPGLGCGRAWSATPSPAEQARRLEAALQRARTALDGMLDGGAGAGLLRVHRLLLDDPGLLGPLQAHLRTGASAEEALGACAAALSPAHLPGRGAPAEEARAVLAQVAAALPRPMPRRPPAGPVVLVGSPPPLAMVLALHREGRLAAVLSAEGGRDAHLGILARELGVPAVMGVGPACWALLGKHIQVGGDRAVVVQAGPGRRAAASPPVRAPVPGFPVRAAISGTAALPGVKAVGAEGIGLLRTDPWWGVGADMLRARLDEAAAVAGADGLTLRTWDRPLGGRPRGPALLETHPAAVETLLAAACATPGPIRVLLPFVTTPGQVHRWRQALAAAARAAGVPCPPLGAMLETPAAALRPHPILAAADFALVGTGDLCALLCGAPREELGGPEFDAARTVLLDLLAGIAGAARSVGRPVALAGPAARDPDMVCHVRDLGFAGVCVAPMDVGPVRDALRAAGA